MKSVAVTVGSAGGQVYRLVAEARQAPALYRILQTSVVPCRAIIQARIAVLQWLQQNGQQERA